MRFAWALITCLFFTSEPAFGGSKKFTLKQLFEEGVARAKLPHALQWATDGNALIHLEWNATTSRWDFYRTEVPSLARQRWFEGASLVVPGENAPISFDHFLQSPDGRFLLLGQGLPSRGVKLGGELFLYEAVTCRLRRLARAADGVSLPQFSPDSKKLAFVRANDLFLLDLITGQEKRLTSGGSKTLLHGHFDWAYEEEFSLLQGWQWSPDSRHIAFWQIDVSRVPEYPLLNYVKPHPEIFWLRYPKAGDPNPQVRIGIVAVESKAVRWLDVGFRGDHYIPRLHWAPHGRALLVQVLNRAQNELDLLQFSVQGGEAKTLLTEREPTWVEITDDLHFFPQGDSFTWTSEKTGYRHLYQVALESGTITPLTQGRWEVSSVLGVDPRGQRVYFLSNREALAEKHLFAVDAGTKSIQRITQVPGTHSPSFEPRYAYFTDTLSNVDMLPQIHLFKAQGEAIGAIAQNDMAGLKEFALARHEFFQFETSQGVLLHGLLMKPADFNPSQRYAVLLAPYGGPGSQRAVNRWGSLWHHYLTQNGYVVALVDNRGTGGRGKAFSSQVYRRLGELESEDQIEAARFLAAQPWADPHRIAIWGWSYGGYLTALTLAKGGALFKAGIAVAPVSHWKYYDSIYTERYLGMPQDNPEGYRLSSPLTHLSGLTASLLVVHGTGDDNVHYQNTLSLIDALVDQNKDVQTLIYPYRTHGLSEGRHTTYHLYRRLTDFLNVRLNGPPVPPLLRFGD